MSLAFTSQMSTVNMNGHQISIASKNLDIRPTRQLSNKNPDKSEKPEKPEKPEKSEIGGVRESKKLEKSEQSEKSVPPEFYSPTTSEDTKGTAVALNGAS